MVTQDYGQGPSAASSLGPEQEQRPGLWQVAPTRAPPHLYCEAPGRCRKSEPGPKISKSYQSPRAALEGNGSQR